MSSHPMGNDSGLTNNSFNHDTDICLSQISYLRDWKTMGGGGRQASFDHIVMHKKVKVKYSLTKSLGKMSCN